MYYLSVLISDPFSITSFYKLLYYKNKFSGHVLFTIGRRVGVDFINNLIYVSPADHCNSDWLSSYMQLHKQMQLSENSKSLRLKNQCVNQDQGTIYLHSN